LSGRPVNSDDQTTIGECLQAFCLQGCPAKNRQPREGASLKAERAKCDSLFAFFGGMTARQLTPLTIDQYADWRIKRVKRGTGGRTVDLDLVTLKAALRWAVRTGRISTNPLGSIELSSYRTGQVKHCRESAPRSGDELHALAAHFFEDKSSETFGWMTLICALTGLRISEARRLRMESTGEESGSIEGDVLWVRRSKRGANNFVRIHPALADCLAAHRTWHRGRHPKSPWWFPGRGGKGVIDITSLTHALTRAGELFDGPRTAHGLRSFYVTVRRSQGVSDAQIALELGQISGGSVIVKTYGDASPRKLDWCPSGDAPAWSPWLPKSYQKATTFRRPNSPTKKRTS